MVHPKSIITSFDLIIIGATGDLSTKKILPALLKRYLDGQIPEKSKIYCISRQSVSLDSFLKFLRKKLAPKNLTISQNKFSKFLSKINYICLDVTDPNEHSIKLLKAHLKKSNNKIRLFYFATAPELFGESAKVIKSNNLTNLKTRVIIEKPIGNDLFSAIKINNILNSCFEEKQIYRIDHYLGKETVQNLMVMRFANQIFETHWSNNSISNVQITVAEEKGIEGRELYYDAYGAIKDMIQNHMLQLLCLVAMEPPSKFDANLVRDEKLKVLLSLKTIDDHNDIALGQYGGRVENKKINTLSYLTDSKNSNSKTETFAALKVNIDNWRWAGVPFFLRTGKRLKKSASEIVITFKPIRHFIFNKEVENSIQPNQLIIRLQPDEGLKVLLMSKEPGPGGIRISPSYLNLSFSDAFKNRIPDAYERLLMDVVRGNQTLFMRRDEVEAAWNWIDPIINKIKKHGIKPTVYESGSWGPKSSSKLIDKYGFSWHEPDNLKRIQDEC